MSRWIPLFLALVACGNRPTTHPHEIPAPPSEGPTPSPMPAADAASTHDTPKITIIGHATPDTLRAAGACPDLEEGVQPAQVEKVEAGGRPLYVVTCETFAYQGTFELWRQQAGAWKAVTDEDDKPVRGLGVPVVTEDGAVSWLEKARGPGDCGEYHEMKDGPRGMRVTLHTARACDAPVGDGEDLGDPRTWARR